VLAKSAQVTVSCRAIPRWLACGQEERRASPVYGTPTKRADDIEVRKEKGKIGEGVV